MDNELFNGSANANAEIESNDVRIILSVADVYVTNVRPLKKPKNTDLTIYEPITGTTLENRQPNVTCFSTLPWNTCGNCTRSKTRNAH